MDATGPKPIQRVAAVLQAKQHLVFFAISLSALTLSVPLAVSWARESAPFDELLARAPQALHEAVLSRQVWLAALVAAYLLVFTWFRAAYLRSLVGRFRLRPEDATQFARLLVLEVVVEVLGALSAWSVAGGVGALALAAGFGLFIANLALLYADYAIVVSGIGPARATAASLACLRRNAGISLLIVLAVVLVQWATIYLLDAGATGSLLRSLPVLVLYLVAVGIITFVVDVVLTVIYLRTTEEEARG